MQESIPNHVFNPAGVLDRGQEMTTLDLPLLGASQLTPVIHHDFQGGEHFGPGSARSV